jgi:DNA-directed RNA polymerase specialized sigma24 family protein
VSPVSAPAPAAGLPSLTTKDFNRFWGDHVGFVRNLARKTLRRCSASRALLRVLRGAPEGALPSVAAVRVSLREDGCLVDDTVQDVGLALWQYLVAGKFLGTTEKDARCFLCTLTVRLVSRAADRVATGTFAAGEPGPEENPDAGEAVDDASSAELAVTLVEVLDLLPEPERLALLAAAEGWTHEELAATLGRTVVASRALRYRAARAAADLLAA